MRQMFATAFLLAAIGLSWLGMIYGWGIQPQHWGWIIGTTFALVICNSLAHLLAGKGGE